ncbi:hypothetical protein RB653_000880 [Dictyostelium firmibasis]|uniref:Clathrin/coatomer adaptor adaptin-like N-terminal domain-containing protein n=1 Tax=Dictyostelium firmibasis TaxID=79012 RepID=A0AAN7U419_9MYCE
MEIEIYDELNSSDSLKQINGLSKLNQFWINQGRDPTLFFTSIIKLISETDNKTTRILCYSILKSCKCTPSDWSLAIPLLVKDLNSDDNEVVISILKTLPHISSIFTELLMMGNADFGPLVRHSNPSVRKTALDTLTSLLFYRKSILQSYKSFVSTGWELIVDRILEEPIPMVYQSSFNAISSLFSEISRSVSHSDELDNSVQKRQVLSYYADWISSKLVDHFDLLLNRAQHIDINQRHSTVNTLTYLVDTISRSSGTPFWPTSLDNQQTNNNINNNNISNNNNNNNYLINGISSMNLSSITTTTTTTGNSPTTSPTSPTSIIASTASSNKTKQISSPQNIVSILVEYFLSQLDSSNDSLVFAVGKAILDLLLTQQNQHNENWINPVLTAFIGLLRREGVSLNPLPILLAIMSVLPMLGDDLLFCTLLRIFPSVKSITDSNQRVSYLIRTFELIIDRHVTSCGKSSLFTPLMTTDCLLMAFQDESSSFREEIIVSMVASHHNILSKYIEIESEKTNNNGSSGSTGPTKFPTSGNLFYLHQAALNISEVCLKCVTWQSERISAIEYCIRFVDWLCRVTLSNGNNDTPHSTKLVALLRSDLLDQINKISSDYICLQSIFLICTHLLRSPTNKVYEQSDAGLLISLLRRRFLFLDNQPKFTQYNGSVRDMIMGVSQFGRVSPASLHSLSGYWLGALECLYLMGLHIPSVEATVQRTLEEILATYPHNRSVYSRARFIRRMLFSSTSSALDASTLGKYSTIRNLNSFTNYTIDFSYCIPIEQLEGSNSLHSTSDIFAYECKKAITGLVGVHYGSSIRDKSSRDVTLISGASDPVWIEVSHTVHPTLNTITLHVQVTNVIHFSIKNVNIMIGLSGHLDFPYPQTNCKHNIPKLLPEKSYSFEVPLNVSSLDYNLVTFKITFNQPSGLCEAENNINLNNIHTKINNYQQSSEQLINQSLTQQQSQQQLQQPPQSISVVNSGLSSYSLNSNSGSLNSSANSHSTSAVGSPGTASFVTSSLLSNAQSSSPTTSSPLSNVINQNTSTTATNNTTATSSSTTNSNNTTTSNSTNLNSIVGSGTNQQINSQITQSLSIGTNNPSANVIQFSPIEIRCSDYIFDWNEFLIPFKYNKHQFIQQWPRFEAVFSIDVVFEGFVSVGSIFDCLNALPFHNVLNSEFGNSNFQFAFSSSTWFNEQFCFTLSGVEKSLSFPEDYSIYYTSPSGQSLPKYKVYHSRFEFRSSSSSLLASFESIIDQWINKLPRPTSNQFIARLLAPDEKSLFSITNITQDYQAPKNHQSLANTPLSNTVDDEIALLNQWKDCKKSLEQTKKLFSQLALDQDFY